MKLKLMIAALALAVLTGAVFYYQSLTPVNMKPSALTETLDANAAPFPDVTFMAPDGKAFHLADLKEPVVLVHFWAAWCAVCHTEFPDLLDYVQRADGRIALIAVSLDNNYTESQKVLDQVAEIYHLNINAPHLYWAWDKDKNISLHMFNTVKVPETIVVKKGLMVNKIIGVAPWKEASESETPTHP